MKKVFIDGSAGTTGLKIYDRLKERKDIELIILGDEQRKDPEARRFALDSSDISFLCLPDVAAEESANMAGNPSTVLIDTSTAHRTSPGWVYGFPELKGYRERIASSKRIANPGCHASGFISLAEPLVREGIISRDIKLSCHSLTGYSGGGKKMIADYENEELISELAPPRMYGLSQKHKHLPEMKAICMLDNEPIFCPVVSSFYSGMEVSIPLFADSVKGGVKAVKEVYREYYHGDIVKYTENSDENGFLSSGKLSGRDTMEISVFGNDERIVLVSRFDNLGKGASGAAIQNMNIVLGTDETKGLII